MIYLDKAIERLKKMTKKEFFDALVKAGICTKTGKLKKKYKNEDRN
jgi:hypothetical protein